VEWLNDPTQESLRRAFVAWLKRIGLKRHVPDAEIDEIDELQEMHAMLAERIEAWHERWKQEGLEQGLEQGEEQGVNKGWHLGEAHVLRSQLQRKFGEPLPGWAEEKLAHASRDQLEHWALTILDAKAIEQVFE
jgi:flagellar biosynthesis/type III secretory pathway protein FliH